MIDLEVFVAIVVCISLLGLIVYGLHKFQAMEVEYNVDRTMPLPPIGNDHKIRAAAMPEAHRREARVEPASSETPAPPSTHEPPKSAITTEESKPRGDGKNEKPESWQDKITAAKNSGNLDKAYTICADHFPLWGAYNQACIILRTRLKSALLSKQEVTALLEQLYRLAVVAELLHDKSEGAEHFTINQLRQLAPEPLEHIDISYQAIGYAQLRLIRKTDIKLILAHWGRPQAHTLPRQALAEWWQNYCKALKT